MDNSDDLVRGCVGVGGLIIATALLTCVGVGVLIGAALF